MKFLLDEGVPNRLANFLVDQGHDVTSVGRDYPYALADIQILTVARQEGRILITNDKDFGDLVFRDRLPHAGIILFRLGYVSIADRIAHLQRVLADHSGELDRFIVVTPWIIRVRPAGPMSPE